VSPFDGWLVDGAERYALDQDEPDSDREDAFVRAVATADDTELHAMQRYITREIASREQLRSEHAAMMAVLNALPSTAEAVPF